MLKSEQIKMQIARLNSAAEETKASLQEMQVSAAKEYNRVEGVISEFLKERRAEIDLNKLAKINAAETDFLKKQAELRAIIDKQTGLTYVPWDDPLWATFDIHKARGAHNLTRLGTFTIKTQNKACSIPAVFSLLGGKNVVLQAEGAGRQKARQVLRNIAFRLLASLPPGKLRFIFIDPVELGSTAAGLVGTLPDIFTGGLAWHEEEDIQNQLSLIETRIASIKTKYLGIQFPSIEEFNAEAGTIEEPYWLIVVSDCPVRFRDETLQKLLSVARNGPQAGVYLAIMLDNAHKKCTDSLVSELTEPANHIVFPDHDDPVFFDDPDFREIDFQLDPPPKGELIKRITEQVNEAVAAAQNVQVTWEAPVREQWWNGDSRFEIKVPLGTYGARKTQFFQLDEKLLNSALIIGKPGSGKSRLLHVLISGLSTRYSPDELTLYLLDCKQVEFKDYATHKLPHARVVAIESEREFGLSVLHRLNSELDSRKTKFSSVGETSLSSYRTKTGIIMPRIILLIDEFQELLGSDDALARDAAGILDRLVRLGRALGINVVLASQTLAGQGTLLPSTKNQIPIRIVLQCSDSDSRAALGQDNDAAQLLERPGEAIYNSANGRLEGNNRFQISWLSDETLELLLDEINSCATKHGFRAAEPPVIFDGNSLADINQNRTLNDILNHRGNFKTSSGTLAWLGEPIEMKDSTAVVFKRQSRSNLLMLGQNEYQKSCISMMIASIVSIAAQPSAQAPQFLILNLTDSTEDWSQLPQICKDSLPRQIELMTKTQLTERLNHLVTLTEKRAVEETSPDFGSVYLFILGLHRERSLRRTDSGSIFSKSSSGPVTKPLSNAELLSKICREGPGYGIHSLIWCDTFSNFDRVFQRNDIDEFGFRIAMQMSQSDSRSLIDSDAANRLGGHRAICFDDEKTGRLERFRPYALISTSWIAEFGRQLGK
jgi:hypothetical protein